MKSQRIGQQKSDLSTMELHTPCGLSTEEFSQLTQAIYDGPFERIPWQTALIQLAALVRARFVALIMRTPRPGKFSLVITSTQNGVEIFSRKEYKARDPFINLPNDRIVTVGEFLGEGNWEQSDFYRTQIEPFGARYCMGADIRTSDGVDCLFRIARLGGQSPFSQADKALSQMVLPHLKRAVHYYSRLDQIESERRFYANAVERMLIGTVILDVKGAIIKISASAQRIVDRQDGIRVMAGTLHAHYEQENRELQRLIGIALCESNNDENVSLSTKVLSITRPSGHAKLSVLIRPIPLGAGSSGTRRPSVAVFIGDPESSLETPGDIVRQLFGFTPAETSLALLLANGLTLDEAALRLGIRKETARTHLRRLFSKTDVSRQTALVRVLLHSVISLA